MSTKVFHDAEGNAYLFGFSAKPILDNTDRAISQASGESASTPAKSIFSLISFNAACNVSENSGEILDNGSSETGRGNPSISKIS